jgi:membrane-associated phospholipid phosphatase
VESFNKKLALATSYLLHPLFMSTNGLMLAFFVGGIQGFNPYASAEDLETAYTAILGVFIGTGVLPVIIAIVLKRLNYISNLHMPEREERMIPFLLTGGSYLSIIIIYSEVLHLSLDPRIYSFMFGATLAIIAGLLITSWWKISVHMIGIGGVVGIMALLSKIGNEVLLYPLIITIIAAGFIGFSRLYLKAHTIKQVIAGFLLGFTCEIAPLILLSIY